MRSNERRFIDHALNNTAWAVVVDRSDAWEPYEQDLFEVSRCIAILFTNERWNRLYQNKIPVHRICLHWLLPHVDDFDKCEYFINKSLHLESANVCTIPNLQIFELNNRSIRGSMFLISSFGTPLGSRFMNRIAKNFSALYRNIIVSAFEKYNAPVPKGFLV